VLKAAVDAFTGHSSTSWRPLLLWPVSPGPRSSGGIVSSAVVLRLSCYEGSHGRTRLGEPAGRRVPECL